jgi:predicted O-methyltransferase YrrM
VKPSYQQGIGRYLQRLRAALRYDAGLVAAPSDRAKRRFLLSLFKQRNHRLFVESGTFLGGTVEYFLPHAKRIVSVEIEPDLHEAARRRFQSSPSVELLLGDAMDVIPRCSPKSRSRPSYISTGTSPAA